jgi:hypothetical protein
MIVTIPADAGDILAELAAAEAERHPPRTRERRAAAHLWTSIVTTTSIASARTAIASFGTPHVQASALELLHRLAAALTTTPKE